jgi:hypothetical protein
MTEGKVLLSQAIFFRHNLKKIYLYEEFSPPQGIFSHPREFSVA